MERKGVEKYRPEDLVCHSNLDMIHICKRKNNTKRDFLFVNKYQGKHVPVRADNVFKAVKSLYDLAYVKLKDKKNILCIGFAETATAIGELFYDYALDEETGLNVSGFVTTTREKVMNDDVLYFDEAHSHAVSQRLYYNTNIVVDTIVFIEDEISTGNTILNCVDKLSKIYPATSYYVVSFCNWQTLNNKIEFSKKNIKAISLYQGELHNLDYKLQVDECKLKDYKNLIVDRNLSTQFKYQTVREVITTEGMRFNNLLAKELATYIGKTYDLTGDDFIEVVGTEEFMGLPLKVANILYNSGYRCFFHATTRSPITVATDTIISDGVKLRSAYDKARDTYLYDLDTIPANKVIIFVEGTPTEEFVSDITNVYINQGLEINNIHLICI